MTGWGVGFHDFDQDGSLDVFLGNGRVELHHPLAGGDDPYAELNQLLRGEGGRFVELPDALPDVPLGSTRAVAFGDYDSDGDVDIAYLDRGGKARLLRNVSAKRGSWIGFKMLNQGGAFVHGAEVRVSAADRIFLRQCQPAYSYCSSSDPAAVVGLGAAKEAEDVVVRWPGGEEESFGSLEAGRYHVLERGAGSAR